MKQKKNLLIFILSVLLTTSIYAKQAMTFSNGETKIALSQDGRNLKYLKVTGVKNHFKGDSSSSLWRLYLFDEKTKALNTYPLHGRGYYWQDRWKMGTSYISSRDAKLVSKHWNNDKKLLTLGYSHPQAEIKMFFKLNPHSIVWWGEFTNKGKLPIYQFTIMDKWQLTYNQQNSFIMPDLVVSGVEYKTIKSTSYAMVNAWDGFLVTSPDKLFSLYAVQPENGPFMGTETGLQGDGTPDGTVAVTSSTLCFRTKGQSLKSVKLKIAAFKNMRSWADNYVIDNFPSIKKLDEKVPDAVRSKLAAAYLMPTGGNMKELTQAMTKIPGTVILHTPGYMRPPVQGANSWDSFPSYFPPNPKYGSLEDYRKLIATARKGGHLFMPRNSFFYWTKGSDPDKKYDLKKLAKIRIDGKPRTARWALPGYIVSPSSKTVLNLLHEYFKTWQGLGAEINFTNVIAAIGPYGNRYDFHPDAPAPDYYYEQIRKMMKWHGDRMPLLTEGAGAWQLPFQAGFCTHPGWDPAHPGPGFLKLPSRGDYVRFRHEIGPVLGHEYVKLYPHNAGIHSGSQSIPKITFSLLHGLNPKFGLGRLDRLNVNNFLWMRTIAVLAKTVFAPIYGAKLENYERRSDKTTLAVYGEYTIIGNYTGKNYKVALPYSETQIAPGGFLFYSPDKSTVAGYFAKFAGHLLKSPQLVIITRKNKQIKLYLPLSTVEIILPIPLKNAQAYKAILHNNGSKSTLSSIYTHDKLLIKVPVIPAKLQKNIPFVSIVQRQTALSPPASMCLQAGLKGSKKDIMRRAVICLKNYGISAKQTSNPMLRKTEIPSLMSTEDIKKIAPLLLEWSADGSKPLPQSKAVDAKLTPLGWKLSGPKSHIILKALALQLNKTIFLECIFRLDSLPPFGNKRGEVNLLHPLGKSGRTIELRYNTYYDAMRFLTVNNKGLFYDLSCFDEPLIAGKWYHVAAWMNGKTQVLIINGKRMERKVSGTLQHYRGPWQLGGGFDITVSYLRIGGTSVAKP